MRNSACLIDANLAVIYDALHPLIYVNTAVYGLSLTKIWSFSDSYSSEDGTELQMTWKNYNYMQIMQNIKEVDCYIYEHNGCANVSRA